MNYKISLGLVTISIYCIAAKEEIQQIKHDRAPLKQRIEVANKPEFYIGLSSGIERMSGRRSESLVEPASIGAPPLNFSHNKNFSSTGDIALSGVSGFLWAIPSTPLSIGSEVYIGKGYGNSIIQLPYLDSNAGGGGEARYYRAAYKRGLFYGGLIRSGYSFYKDYLISLSIGVDFSKFSLDQLMNKDGSVFGLFPNPIFRSKKTLIGFVYGIGIEKKFNSLRLGLELKGVHYKKANYSKLIPTTPGFVGNTFLNFSVRPVIYSLSMRVSYLF